MFWFVFVGCRLNSVRKIYIKDQTGKDPLPKYQRLDTFISTTALKYSHIFDRVMRDEYLLRFSQRQCGSGISNNLRHKKRFFFKYLQDKSQKVQVTGFITNKLTWILRLVEALTWTLLQNLHRSWKTYACTYYAHKTEYQH